MTAISPVNSTVAQKRILFVDDDTEFLQMMERLLRLWSNNSVDVLSAQNASAALAILQESVPDVIAIDVCMPVVDGLQLLAMVHRRYPGTPKVVLTSQPDDAYRKACLDNGAELFLEKPRTAEGFEAIFATLDELTRWKPQPGFRGMLRSVGLTDVIQMECIAKSSSILTVTSSELTGAIFIKDGAIIHAQAGELKGEDAFKSLIALLSGDFASRPFADPPEQTINLPWESLLMDAAQSRDELLGSQPAEQPALSELPHRAEEAAPGTVSLPSPPIEIDELMICSDAGDVYHSWHCDNTELRINLLEFLALKARALQEHLPFGPLDRVEFIASGSRLIAQSGAGRRLVVRSSLSGIAASKNDSFFSSARAGSAPQVRNKALHWFEDQLDLPGLFAGLLQFPDRTGPTHARAPQFTPEALELLRRSALEGFQVIKLQRFHAQRARWNFEQMTIESAHWADGTLLALVLNRRALELNLPIVEKQINSFLSLEAV